MRWINKRNRKWTCYFHRIPTYCSLVQSFSVILSPRGHWAVSVDISDWPNWGQGRKIGGCYWLLVGRGQRSCRIPVVHRIADTAEDHSHKVQQRWSAEAGSLAWRAASLVGQQSEWPGRLHGRALRGVLITGAWSHHLRFLWCLSLLSFSPVGLICLDQEL